MTNSLIKIENEIQSASSDKTLATIARKAAEYAKQSLVPTKTVEEKLEMFSQSKALQDHFKRRLKDKELAFEIQNIFAEIHLRMQRDLGNWLADMDKAKGAVQPGTNRGTTRLHDATTSLSDLGIEKTQSHRWQQIAQIPEEQFEEELDKQKEQQKELTSVHFQRVAKNLIREKMYKENENLVAENDIVDSLKDNKTKYSTLVIDPPWDWGDEGDQNQLGRARPTYKALSFGELLALPIENISEENCHLYLWITNRSLPKGFELIEAWGFRYITCITWCKPSIGMGNYFRGSTEQVLFCMKGSLPLKRKDVGTWFNAPRGKGGHSSKPDEFYELVESCSLRPYADIFGRGNRKNWTLIGAEAL